MVEIERKVTIKRPLEDVFRYMSDAENDRLWRTNVKEIERTTGGDRSGVGTVYRQKLKGPFGGFRADLRYTEYEPSRRIAFETINGSVRPTATIDFSSAGEEVTDVHIRMRWQPTGGWRLGWPLMARLIESNMNASYDNLVRKLEAGEDEAELAGREEQQPTG